MKKPLSVRIGQNLILTSSLSFLPTGLIIYTLYQKIKNPKIKTLVNTNKVMSFIHLTTAIIMYFNKPIPKKDDFILLKQDKNIKVDEFYSFDNNINKIDLENNYLDNNAWHVYKYNKGKMNLYKKIIILDERECETDYKVYNMFLLKKNKKSEEGENEYVLCYAKEINEKNLKEIKTNLNTEYKLAEFDLKEFDWGVNILYQKPKYIFKEEDLYFEKKEQLIRTNLSVWNNSALFSLITFFFHFAYGFLIREDQYQKWLNKKINPLRWIEYFFSSGIMMTNFASLATVENKHDLINVFILTAVTNIFGMAIDETNLKQKYLQKISFFIAGYICFIMPVYMIQSSYSKILDQLYEPIGVYKQTSYINIVKVLDINSYNTLQKVLPYSGTIIGILYLIFPIIQILQVLYPEKYKLGELLFIFASLISKLTLNIYAYYEGKRPPSISYLLNRSSAPGSKESS